MATISNTPRPGYVWDSTDNVWYPIGVGGHSHSEIASTIADAKGDLIVGTAADAVARLAVGTNNHTLIADSAEVTGLKYAAGSKATLTTTGDILYASAANTPARLGIGSASQVLTVASGIPSWATPAAASVTFSGCSLRQNAGQSLSNNTQTDLLYDVEDFDTDAYHSLVTNTNRITIPTGKSGYFLVSARTTYATNSSGTRVNWLLKNNVTYLSTVFGNPGSADNLTLVTSAIVSLVATDYITINAYQGSGGSLSTVTDQGKTNFSIQFLGV